MPKMSGGGGFADILKYDKTINQAEQCERENHDAESNIIPATPSEIRDSIMLNRMKKSCTLSAIGLGWCLMAVLIGVITMGMVIKCKNETIVKIEETKKEICEYENQIISLLEEFETDDVENDHKSQEETEKKDEIEVETDNINEH